MKNLVLSLVFFTFAVSVNAATLHSAVFSPPPLYCSGTSQEGGGKIELKRRNYLYVMSEAREDRGYQLGIVTTIPGQGEGSVSYSGTIINYVIAGGGNTRWQMALTRGESQGFATRPYRGTLTLNFYHYRDRTSREEKYNITCRGQ